MPAGEPTFEFEDRGDAWRTSGQLPFAKLRNTLRVIGVWAMSLGGLLISGGFALGGLALVASGCLRPSPGSLFVVPLGGAMFALSLWHVVATILALLRPQLPAPIQVALAQPRWPRGVNLLIVFWWLMHVSFGAMFAIATLVEKPPDAGFVVFAAIMSIVFTYSAHGFLMLVTTCLTRRSDWIVRVWGWRRLIAAAHGIAVLVVGLMR